mgnify:FL=1
MSERRDRQGAGRVLELKVPPLLLFALFAAAMFGLSWAAPATAFSLPGSRAAATLLALSGLGIALAGVAAFRRHKTTVNPLVPSDASSVVASGVYRHSRNPMYLGILLLLAGWALFLSNTAAALLLPAFVAYMNRFQIAPEERILAAKFGAPFTDYTAAVRRWL